MDPISAVGIGLSATGLTLQVFAGCIKVVDGKGYQLFIDARDVPAAYQHLRVRLRIEQARLLNWGQKIGLDEEGLDEPSWTLRHNRNLIVDILFQIQAIFRTCVAIEGKYEALASHERTESQDVSPGQDAFNQRFPKTTRAFLRKTLGLLERTSEVPKRLYWAMLKKDEFETMVQKLIGYNTSIEALLDSTAIDQLQHMQQQTYIALLQLNAKVIELEEVSMALNIKAEVVGQDTQARLASTSERRTHSREAEVARLADFKAKQIQVEAQSSEEVVLQPLETEQLHFFGLSNDRRSEASFQNKSVWVEWKYNHLDLSLHPKWRRIIEDRVKKLAFLLQPANKPPEFNAPHCLGYFLEDDDTEYAEGEEGIGNRWGFVYLKPPSAASDAAPMSLLEIINRADRQRPPPSLTSRFRLAYTLAHSLMYLHSVNWIHKALRSDNVIFFAAPDAKGAVDLAADPVIAGFEYARPDLPDEVTEPPPVHSEDDVYRHPDIVRRSGARSQKSHDIYSLGVVLIEIAYWQPINAIILKGSGNRQDVRRLLLDGPYLKVIEGAMGEIYGEVVRKCLFGGEALGVPSNGNESDMEVGLRMLDVFSSQIVRQLSNIRV